MVPVSRLDMRSQLSPQPPPRRARSSRETAPSPTAAPELVTVVLAFGLLASAILWSV